MQRGPRRLAPSSCANDQSNHTGSFVMISRRTLESTRITSDIAARQCHDLVGAHALSGMPAKLGKPADLLAGRRKSTWLPGPIPSMSRTALGIVTCPFAVTVVLMRALVMTSEAEVLLLEAEFKAIAQCAGSPDDHIGGTVPLRPTATRSADTVVASVCSPVMKTPAPGFRSAFVAVASVTTGVPLGMLILRCPPL